ncbi:hypothetical protein EAE96_004742 [Botrytis aclada]|nr:hypothetical protein EAE96_004742 [Botrytis aclada]
MNHPDSFRVRMDSLQKVIDGLDVQTREELTRRLPEEAQQRYLDLCKQFGPWGQEDFIHLSNIAPPNFFVDIISSYKSRLKLMPPTEDIEGLMKLTTKSIVKKRKNINKTCNLNVIPPELREQIFRLILKDYFTEYPKRSVLVYQNWIMGPYKNINILGNAGLALEDLPAFEIALIPDQKLYREFFALRIKQCTIELRPSVTWSHVYSFPPEVQVADPPKEITEWVTDTSKSSFEYMAWVYLQEKELGLHLPLRGWLYHYPSLSKLSPIMLDNIRSVDIILRTDHLDTQYIDGTNALLLHSTFSDLLYAANLASLSYSLSYNERDFKNKFKQTVTLPTTEVLPTILRSLKHYLAVEPKQSTLNTNPHSSIPAPLSLLTTFAIKTFDENFPESRFRSMTIRQNLAILRKGTENINRLLEISSESSWGDIVPGIGWRKIDRGFVVSCYQLVWTAGFGRKLLICKKTEIEQLNG